MQTLGKNESGSTFSANSIAHMLEDNIKSILPRKSIFLHAPEKPANQGINFAVISNVTRLLTLVLKFRQCIVTKDHISMKNGDNFITFAC